MSKMQIKLYKKSWTEQKHRIKMEYIKQKPKSVAYLTDISQYFKVRACHSLTGLTNSFG